MLSLFVYAAGGGGGGNVGQIHPYGFPGAHWPGGFKYWIQPEKHCEKQASAVSTMNVLMNKNDSNKIDEIDKNAIGLTKVFILDFNFPKLCFEFITS